MCSYARVISSPVLRRLCFFERRRRALLTSADSSLSMKLESGPPLTINLPPYHWIRFQVSGALTNTGHGIVFKVSESATEPFVTIQGGPLSYSYRFYELHLHYGKSDDQGSEHTIASKQFPAEVSILITFIHASLMFSFVLLSPSASIYVGAQTIHPRRKYLPSKYMYSYLPMLLADP